MDERPDTAGFLAGLLSELKRRRVIRVALAYGAAAWIVVEVTTTTFGPLGLPGALETAIIVIALLGFPVVIGLAWAFDITARGIERTSSGEATTEPVVSRTATRALIAFGALIVVAVLGVGGWLAFERSRIDVDDELVAVLPFRVSGADPSLAYLREGVPDLLTVTLGGVTGTRSMDLRTVLAGWRAAVSSETDDLPPADAARVGVSLGAGRVLLGHVAGAPDALTVSAHVIDVVTGVARSPVEVRGSLDSLPDLVDRLASQLLALETGEDEHRLRSLVGASVPAVRAYLEGRRLYRRGRYGEAITQFREAITRDTSFALAASEMGRAGRWVRSGAGDAFDLAWAARDRLGPRDLALLEARLGPRHPELPTGRELVTAAERAVRLAPDSPEAWFQLGDWLFHHGRQLGMPDWIERSRQAFDRALELDPFVVGPIQHATELAAIAGDTSRVRQLGDVFFQRDSIGEVAVYMRWLTAASLDDDSAVTRLHESLDSLPTLQIIWMTAMTQAEQIRSQDFDVYLDELMTRSGITQERYALLLNAGRPGLAAEIMDGILPGLSSRLQRVVRVRMVESALYGGADTARGASAVAALAAIVDEPPPDSARGRFLNDLWTVAQWRVWHGDTTGAGRALRLLRERRPTDPPELAAPADMWALLLDAMLAVLGDRSDADAILSDLEARFAAGPDANVQGTEGAFILSRLLEDRGHPERALEVIRRRLLFEVPSWHLSTRKREEGRLAALIGDTATAVAAYAHYLAMRENVEPEVQPEVDRIREELRRLVGEGR